MAAEYKRAQHIVELLRKVDQPEGWIARLAPDYSKAPPAIRHARQIREPDVRLRWAILKEETQATGTDEQILFDSAIAGEATCFERNIENFVGAVRLPVGVAGPLRIRGTRASGDYYVPLATTEAALVASYHRGARLLTAAGGCRTALLSEGVQRSPGFAFSTLVEAGQFAAWATTQFDNFKNAAAATSHHAQLQDLYLHLEGNHVYLCFEFTTGDASGQNMVTIATQAICEWIRNECPIRPQWWLVEANFSGDKKASALSFLTVRGRKVTAETIVPAALVEKHIHVSPDEMSRGWRFAALGGVMSGTMGVQGQYANALAAVFLATGQDVACVAESAVGVTRMEVTPDGSLYASVTLPNLIVGTVGGGTGLPGQRACLNIANSAGAGRAQAFAEICAALCLAGELSISGAMIAGEFARAHERLARGKRKSPAPS